MTRVRIASCLALLVASLACSSLNYPDTPDAPGAPGAPGAPDGSQAAPSAPVLLGLDFGIPESDIDASEEEIAQEWDDLTRRARADRQQGQFDAARDGLEKASIQLSMRAPSNAQRRTVFGMRARLAMDFAALGQDQTAEDLADQLFEEVEQEPQLGGPAIVELAYLFSQRRAATALEAGLPESQLPLFRIALISSESAAASQDRLSLAFEISNVASAEGDHGLARRAIDRAVLDAQTIAPSDKSQIASLKILKARIAIAQGDLATAVATATSANRIFAAIDAPSPQRAIAEATVARALAEAGEIERARAIAMGAQARIGGDPPLAEHSARLVLAELARLELAAGDPVAARSQFQAALDIPGIDSADDVELVARLTEELAALRPTPPAGTPVGAPAGNPAGMAVEVETSDRE